MAPFQTHQLAEPYAAPTFFTTGIGVAEVIGGSVRLSPVLAHTMLGDDGPSNVVQFHQVMSLADFDRMLAVLTDWRNGHAPAGGR